MTKMAAIEPPEAIEVTARFLAEGGLQVLRFRWDGRIYTVTGSGRRWQAEDGLHLLLQAQPEPHAPQAMFELRYDAQAGRWFMGRRALPEESV